jgi:NADPH:quinone reductase-like Zn-dependent oxidoreductase
MVMMMKAMRLTYQTSQAKEVEIEKPSVAVDSSNNNQEVLIHVKYSAIDTALDAVVQKAFTGSFLHARTDPLVLGWHFVGTVVEIGAAGVVDNKNDNNDPSLLLLAVDDLVWGFLPYDSGNKQGSLAEFIKVPHDQCGRIPNNNNSNTLENTITMMAASSTESLTALQAMRDSGGLSQGKTILILGSGGAVGSAAVQIAKILGAHVTAVCSTKDYDRVKAFGADVVIDRSKEQDPLGGSTEELYDVIFDTTGQYSALQGLSKLQPKGTFVATLPSLSLVTGMILSFFRSGKKSVKMIQCHSNRTDLDLAASWIADKKLLIDVNGMYDIKDLEKAIARHQEKAKVGRVVIRVEGGW